MNSLKIIEYMREHKLSKCDFCKLCEIDIQTLDEIVYFGKYDNQTLEKIATKLNINYYQFFIY